MKRIEVVAAIIEDGEGCDGDEFFIVLNFQIRFR